MSARGTRRGGAPVVEISYAFGFDAAHRFKSMPRGHKYRGMHGHSFRAEVAIRGAPRPPHGCVADLARVERACGILRKQLDHKLLNEIKGLNNPSLECLALWIWDRLATRLPGLARVTVRRDSLGQSCTYRGPDGGG
ncbi:MAG: 6-carboxytetrahydropterin synthase [Betaproteobacteria bacterium]|nr:6-carboxytetrahydropterin synthase [Betaproteobacteria bacterium]